MKLLDYSNVLKFVSEAEIEALEGAVLVSKEKLLTKFGTGSEYLGWVDYPLTAEKELDRILKTAEKIQNEASVLLVIGIGGSYLGAKAGLSMLSPYLGKTGKTELVFVGNTLSSTYTQEIIDYLADKDFSINVISKSGTTTEPALAFRLFRNLLQEKYGDKAKNRIYATTTIGKGVLYQMAKENGYETFSIPEDIGGRYSVLTPVGLLPLAVAGIDIKAIIAGAQTEREKALEKVYPDNDALLYAAIRNLLYRKGKAIEIFVTYEPKLKYLGEWYKQLFGESEGKDGKGLFPASVLYTTDLHSLGQYVQDGRRILFETVINIDKPEQDILLKEDAENLDGLNYLAGKTLDTVNKQALKGTVLAHVDGSVPNLILNIPEISPYQFGRLVYFFMFACGVSGHLLGVNPFNQEGVEAYKKNMFALLGKPGFEELRERLLKNK
ncbi:MAG TPA: glucose-6-phosphate isomerase [Acholeplasmataceae bacterium]|jgi:glucose-6-phosphate isomerase|nr:glucose-6-phosphate isomerase [Acholeplasmataceae bacterium]